MRAPRKKGSGRTCAWIPPDREWLEIEHIVKGKPLKQIAEEVGTGEKTVQSWRHSLIDYESFGHPISIGEGSATRVYGLSAEWLHDQYWNKGKASEEIARELHVNRVSILSRMRNFGIPARSSEERGRRHSKIMSGAKNPSWAGGTSAQYHANFLKKSGRARRCEWCGTTGDLQVHHIDHDRGNGAFENLIWLCGFCNRLEAQLRGLVKEGNTNYEMIDNQLIITFHNH